MNSLAFFTWPKICLVSRDTCQSSRHWLGVPRAGAGGAQASRASTELILPCLEGCPGSWCSPSLWGAHAEASPPLAREQAQPIANLPSKILRRAPKPYLFFPSAFQILSPAEEMAPNSGFRPGGTGSEFLWGREAASSSGSHLPEVCSPRIRTLPRSQRSLLPPTAGEKNSQVRRGNPQTPLNVGPQLGSLFWRAVRPSTILLVHFWSMSLDCKTLTQRSRSMKCLACLKHTVPSTWNVLPLLSAAVPQRPPPPRSLPWVSCPHRSVVSELHADSPGVFL